MTCVLGEYMKNTFFSASFQFLKLSNPPKKNANVFIIKLRSELISITNNKHHLTFALCYPYNIIAIQQMLPSAVHINC